MVADLFAGSGIIGFEAASRGAGKTVFIEEDKNACDTIKKNTEALAKAGVKTGFEVIKGNVMSFCPRSQQWKFDYIFMDPPYADTEKVLSILLADKGFAKFASGALVIVKIPGRMSLNFFCGLPNAEIRLKRRFGGTDFIFVSIGSGE